MKGTGPRRERRWQTSQERARVAAELIEEAESLTQTGAIATPHDVARDQQPPPIRVAPVPATPGTPAKMEHDDMPKSPEEAGAPTSPASAPAPAPLPPASTASPEP